MSGYSKFGSTSVIMEYDFKTEGEVTQALGDLEAMYEDGNISEYLYKNVRAYLEDKLKEVK